MEIEVIQPTPEKKKHRTVSRDFVLKVAKENYDEWDNDRLVNFLNYCREKHINAFLQMRKGAIELEYPNATKTNL